MFFQDPDVVNAPLPVFHRPPSTERDTTLMRPPAHDASLLHLQKGPGGEFLLPMDNVELHASPSGGSAEHLLGEFSTICNFLLAPTTEFMIYGSHLSKYLQEIEAFDRQFFALIFSCKVVFCLVLGFCFACGVCRFPLAAFSFRAFYITILVEQNRLIIFTHNQRRLKTASPHPLTINL